MALYKKVRKHLRQVYTKSTPCVQQVNKKCSSNLQQLWLEKYYKKNTTFVLLQKHLTLIYKVLGVIS